MGVQNRHHGRLRRTEMITKEMNTKNAAIVLSAASPARRVSEADHHSRVACRVVPKVS
ncbi:hypothetical protein ABIE87_008598 [Bradyrhizobium diazoefficiens]